MEVKFDEKFSDRNLDKTIYEIYTNYIAKPSVKYQFDLTNVEFIGNQELLVLSAIFKSLVDAKKEFEIIFFQKGISTNKIEKRVKRQIIEFWEVWKIWKILPPNLHEKYFGINGNTVQRLQEELNYYPKISEIYSRHGVTPFVSLEFINNYSEPEIQKRINPIYKLNTVIEQLLKINNCYHPFTSNSLSTIVTEELYLNFLDHSSPSAFPGFPQSAFMSISFHGKLEGGNTSDEKIQRQKSLNFNTECLEETKSFFYDSKKKKFKNDPYIQFSFVDFGQGIAKTLKSQFDKVNTGHSNESVDSDILKFAFNHDTSRHPILNDKNESEYFIPRGLFDALTIVRRYRGLLIIRSNYGKILFNFADTSDINNAFSTFGNKKVFFPGTLITLYIPAIEDVNKLNVSSIKPEVLFTKVTPSNEKYVNVGSIVENLPSSKASLYSQLLHELKKEICKGLEHSLAFISFRGCNLPKRIIKKTIYFLLSDYDINNKNNVVILHSPSDNIISEIASEILMLNDAIKNYKLHPLPIIDFNKTNNDLNITWLGIYSDLDKIKLNQLLYQQYSIARTDFQDPANISGHLNEFDTYGNLISNFPSTDNIINFFKLEEDIFISKQVEDLLKKHECIKFDNKRSLYLCNANYYQREYVELNNLLNNKTDLITITEILFEKICQKIKNLEDYKFIGVTTAGHRILKCLELQGLIKKDKYISLDNYHNIENELESEHIEQGEKFILVCDVFSTGSLTNRLQNQLNEKKANLELIAVIVSISDPANTSNIGIGNSFDAKKIFLHERKIKKFKRNDISNEVIEKEIIRVNPFTNIPIRLSIMATNYAESIIFPSTITFDSQTNHILIRNGFLEHIPSNLISIGFFKFNNLIHPYFFDTSAILKGIDNSVLGETFKVINRSEELKIEKNIKLFYPRKSGIESFDFQQFNNTLKNDSIEYIEIERFGTAEGWRFPHNTDYLTTKIKNNLCFILDDGACSGDSLIQMIDEISFYDAKEIILLCLITRVNDHKREFFSRISSLKVHSVKNIPISIFFVCHLHIPTYYIDENPSVRETVWLNKLIAIQNTPQSIREIAKTVMEAIKPRTKENFTDYKYLPRERGTQEIPKKDLLLVREEIGKVIGYRLYKESFIFFDYLIKKYENKSKEIRFYKNRYKEIELLCACFIYEPYLYEKIKGILPDVGEKLEEFVDILIFNNKAIAEHLTYEWDKKDIIHLFFIIFKNEKLIKKLNKEKFFELAEFTKPKESALNYVLYKLLVYFPIENSDVHRYDTEIKKLLLGVSDLEHLSFSARNKIKIYRWFISSLPSSDILAISDSLYKLKANFEKIIDQRFHDDNIFNDKQIINSSLLDIGNKIRKGEIYEYEIEIIKKHWKNIAEFIKDLLSFSRGYPKFFIDERLFAELETNENSLRTIYGELTEIIYNHDFASHNVGSRLNNIFAHFILDDSQPLKIFSKPKANNPTAIVQSLFTKIKSAYPLNFLTINIEKSIILDFPNYFFELILKEIYNNLRHVNKRKDLKIYVTKTRNNYFKVKIWNFLNDDDISKGGNTGMKILKNLNNPYHDTYYRRYYRSTAHLQIIKIKIL